MSESPDHGHASSIWLERSLIVIIGLLLLGQAGIHGYHIAYDVIPADRIKWTIVVPIGAAFSFFHALYTLGWRRALLFLSIACVTGFGFEFVGVHTGLIFGHYVYADHLLGPKILDTVPWIIPFAYFMMLYPSYVITNLILDGRAEARGHGVWRVISATMLTALIMTAWDLSMDPVMSSGVKACVDVARWRAIFRHTVQELSWMDDHVLYDHYPLSDFGARSTQ